MLTIPTHCIVGTCHVPDLAPEAGIRRCVKRGKNMTSELMETQQGQGDSVWQGFAGQFGF